MRTMESCLNCGTPVWKGSILLLECEYCNLLGVLMCGEVINMSTGGTFKA